MSSSEREAGGRSSASPRVRRVETTSPDLERAPHDRPRDAVAVGGGGVGAPARHAQAQPRDARVAGARGRAVGEQQEAALGAGDVHDRVGDLLQHGAQDQRGVERLDQLQQQLLLLDPWQLGHGAGSALAAEWRELERHVPELDLRPRGELGAPDLRGVDVDAVHAARVLDEEVAVLVLDAGVELGDRGLVERDVVVARAPDVVGAGLQEPDLLG